MNDNTILDMKLCVSTLEQIVRDREYKPGRKETQRYLLGKCAEVLSILNTFPNPDWSRAPNWANWWAIDAGGDAFFFYEKPELAEEEGIWMGGEEASITDYLYDDNYQLAVGVDWRASLRHRTI